MKRSLQKLCCEACFFPLISRLFGLYYAAAMNLLVKSFSGVEHVSFIAVKRGFVEGGFLPAYSDLDIIVVLDDIDWEEEVRVLPRLRKIGRFYQFCFPIFAHLSISSRSDLDQWLQWGGPRKSEASRWKILYERTPGTPA